MRKAFFVLILAIISVAVRGQTATFAMTVGETWAEKNTNYTLTNTTAQWFQFNAPQHYLSFQDFQVVLKKGTGTQSRVDVTLYGRKFDNDSWVQIGTSNWQHGVNDSIVTISSGKQNAYRQFKVNYAGTGTGTSTIDRQTLKLWFF